MREEDGMRILAGRPIKDLLRHLVWVSRDAARDSGVVAPELMALRVAAVGSFYAALERRALELGNTLEYSRNRVLGLATAAVKLGFELKDDGEAAARKGVEGWLATI